MRWAALVTQCIPMEALIHWVTSAAHPIPSRPILASITSNSYLSLVPSQHSMCVCTLLIISTNFWWNTQDTLLHIGCSQLPVARRFSIRKLEAEHRDSKSSLDWASPMSVYECGHTVGRVSGVFYYWQANCWTLKDSTSTSLVAVNSHFTVKSPFKRSVVCCCSITQNNRQRRTAPARHVDFLTCLYFDFRTRECQYRAILVDKQLRECYVQ